MSDPDAALHVDVIEGLGAVSDLERAWAGLMLRAADADPFVGPDWLLPWCRHVGSDVSPVLVTVSREGTLVGIAPCARADGTIYGLGGSVTDYHGALVDRDASRKVADALFAAILRLTGALDVGQLRGGSPLLAATAPPGTLDRTEPAIPCPVARLDRVPDEIRRAARYARRRFERDTGGAIEASVGRAPEGHVDALFRLHGARWQARGERGVLDDPAVRAMHRDVARRAETSGTLLWARMTARGDVVGALYGFFFANTAYYYLSGFDPAFAKHSPGNVLVAAAIDTARERGATRLDFLRGQEAYKYRWGAVDQPTFRRIAKRSSSP